MVILKCGTSFGKVFILFVVICTLNACATAPVKQKSIIPAKRPVSEIIREDVVYPVDAYDPWEGFNRRIYKFNAKIDKYIFLPVVNLYETITPDFMEWGISNFFLNLGEITNLTNSILQLKGESTLKTAERIVINTTVGMGGLFDPSTSMGIYRQDEDFGQTLGHYGLKAGPYFVLPVFGPSSLRDVAGLTVDLALYNAMFSALVNEFNMDSSDEDLLNAGVGILRSIDTRHRTKFRYYETGSPFEYEWIRKLYLQKREMDVLR